MIIKTTLMIKTFVCGLFMGLAGMIPGVSSGTIAVITGIYREMIEALDTLLSRSNGRLKAGLFLAVLASGVVIATFLFASIIERLINAYPDRMSVFFVGLILGTAPTLLRQVKLESVRGVGLSHGVILLSAMVFVFWIGSATMSNQDPVIVFSFRIALGLFIAGFISSATALIPGISGSMVLLAIGVYGTMITAISQFYWPLLLALGLGALIGFVTFSKVIKLMLGRHASWTYCMISGFLIGSIYHLLPGSIHHGLFIYGSYAVLLVSGFLLAYLLGGERRHA